MRRLCRLCSGYIVTVAASLAATDYEDFTIGSEGRFDVFKNSDVFGGMRFSPEHESRESPDDVSGAEPTRYYKLDGHAGTSHRVFEISLGF